jgi:hypothetical protein
MVRRVLGCCGSADSTSMTLDAGREARGGVGTAVDSSLAF